MKKIIAGFIIALFCSVSVHAYTPDSNAPRANVPEIYKWNVTQFIKSEGAWQKTYRQVKKELKKFAPYKGELGDATNLKACLDQVFATNEKLDHVAMYANLKNNEDQEIERYQEMRQKSVTLIQDFQAATSFIIQELLKLDEGLLYSLLEHQALTPYRSYLQAKLRRKTRVLNEEAERLLNLFGDNLFIGIDLNDVPSDTEMVFKAIMRDLKFPLIKDEAGKEVQLNLSNYSKYRASKDRRVRREAVSAFLGVLKDYENILAATLAGEFKRDVTLARARKYDRAIDAYLDREDVDPKVVDNLIRTIHKNLKPLHRYVDLRKKMLGLRDIHIYDLYTPLVASVDSEVPYEEGAADVVAALKPLGSEYLKVLKHAIKPGSGWVDIYPHKGKRSGAFSASIWGPHPVILLNYLNDIDGVTTLAHELGHSLHSHFNMQVQPYPTFGYTMFTAEIASTTNETLLSEYLLDKYKDNDEMRLYLLGERLELIRGTIYRQTLFAEFEKEIHAYAEGGEPLTAKLLNQTYRDLIRKYYGPGFTIDENDAIEWAYIPHFYWKFYVFNYATGLSSGIALAEMVLDEGEIARDRYLAMLQAPDTEPPLEILKKAGVDMTKPAPIKAAADLMNRTIDEMEKIIARRKK